MLSTVLLTLLWLTLTAARGLDHQRRQGTTVTCSFAVKASNGDTCNSLASAWGLSLGEFQALNPTTACPSLVVGNSYCVFGSVTTISTTSTSFLTTTTTKGPGTGTTITTTTTPTTTTTGTTTANPHQPTQPGLAPDCNKFYFVNPGDTCAAIAAQNSITFAQFYAWNPAVGQDCTTMWANTWVCVGVPGATTSPPPATTQPPSGPQPQMPGIVANCQSYYMIQSGDSCWTIQQTTGTSLAQIRAWNSQVNAECTNLWLGYYICVRA